MFLMANKVSVLETIDRLFENPEMGYYALMDGYRYQLAFAQRYFNNTAIRGKIREIKRRAFVKSVSGMSPDELHEGKNGINKNHPALFKAARVIYGSCNGKSFWRKGLEDAGISLPRLRGELDLKSLFERLSSISENPRDFKYRKMHKKDPYAAVKSRKFFGKYGKAVMLVGVDFITLPRVRKKEHQFTREDFSLIRGDDSLSKEEKARAVFYGLTFQYYGFKNYHSYAGRSLDSNGKFLSRYMERQYLGKIHLDSYRHQMSVDDCRVVLELDRDIDAKFHKSEFRFEGADAERDSLKFRMGIEWLLSC